MSPLALFSLLRLRFSLYALLGLLVLSTLWVTSLTLLSAPQNATELLTDAGSQVLNPFLAKQGYGLTQQTYDSRKAHLNQALTLTPLNVHVTGSDIDKPTYDEAVQVVYKRVATAYYSNGSVDAVFVVPPELKQIVPALPNFGLYGATGATGTTTAGLPDFLQPFFTVVGLTPATFTDQGHQNLLHLLPWFWLATLVLGVLVVLVNRSANKLSGLANTVVHSTWPIVLLSVGTWGASLVYAGTFAPYKDALGVLERTFLPVYGGALVVGAIALVVPKLLIGRQQGQPQQPAMVGMPAGAPRAAMTDAPSTPPLPSFPTYPPSPPSPSFPTYPSFGQLPDSPADQSGGLSGDLGGDQSSGETDEQS